MMLNHCELRHLFQTSIFYPSLKYSVYVFRQTNVVSIKIYFFSFQRPSLEPLLRPQLFTQTQCIPSMEFSEWYQQLLSPFGWYYGQLAVDVLIRTPTTLQNDWAGVCSVYLSLFFSLSCPYSNANHNFYGIARGPKHNHTAEKILAYWLA